jgi:hypothetical protein
MNMINKKITIGITVVSLLVILFSGCISSGSVAGKYVYETGAFFILNEDMTFRETFSNGNTASGEYTIESPSGNLTMVYRPFGSFIVMEKIETKNGTGYKNKYGGVYEKE